MKKTLKNEFLFVAKVMLSLLVSFAFLGPLNNNVSADTMSQSSGFLQYDAKVSNIILSHLDMTDDHTIFISDEEGLNEKLKNHGTDIEVEYVQSVVKQYNSIMNGEQGEKKKNELLKFNESLKQSSNAGAITTASGCSNAVTITGFAHTSSYGALAIALGVSSPVGFAVGTGIAALYAAGSVACSAV